VNFNFGQDIIVFALLLVLYLGCAGQQSQEAFQRNELPIAEAGDPLQYSSDQSVRLDGGSSIDPEGDWLIYRWSFRRLPDESTLELSAFSTNNSLEKETSFQPDFPGIYFVELVVVDQADVESKPDSVIVSVSEGQIPLANAGADIEALEGERIELIGSESTDPLGRELNYTWSIVNKPSGSFVEIDEPTNPETFIVADKSGFYLISLVVNNGFVDSLPDVFAVDVASLEHTPPIAVAGGTCSELSYLDQDSCEQAGFSWLDSISGEDCGEILLDGGNSFDVDGDELSYFWTLQSKPETSTVSTSSFSNPTGDQSTLYVDQAGEYTVSLAVNDGNAWSFPDLLTIDVSERTLNTPPTVVAGEDLSADAGEGDCQMHTSTMWPYPCGSWGCTYYTCNQCQPLTMPIGDDASVVDLDGDLVSYRWEVINGNAHITDQFSIQTTATFSGAIPDEEDPAVCTFTNYKLQLIANDCPGDMGFDQVSVTMYCCGSVQ
jgi:hypothetical protein